MEMFTSRLDNVEKGNRIGTKDRSGENNQMEAKRQKDEKQRKRYNGTYGIYVQSRKRVKKSLREEAIFEEMMAKNFLKAIEDIKSQILEHQNPVDINNITPRHITMNLLKIKDKEKIYKAVKSGSNESYYL